MAFGIADVFRRVGFVKKKATGGERGGQQGELTAKQAPDDNDEVEGLAAGGPGDGFFGGFTARGDGDTGGSSTLGGNGETFVGEVGEGDSPSALGEPEGVAASAAGEVKRAAGSEVRTCFDEEGIGLGGLRFAGEEFCVPAVAVGAGVWSHVSMVILLM